jgi:hypothetical protein
MSHPLLARPLLLLFCTLGSLLNSACTALLPSTRQEESAPWSSYEEAVQSLSSLKPYHTPRSAVHAQGLDPKHAPMVKRLHFADVLQRLSPAMLLHSSETDRGIRDCWQAGQRCTGYAVSVRKVTRLRGGNFWLDSLNFKRITVTSGWSVEALLVFVDDELVYALMGGQPTILVHEETRNPLGPLQGWGNHLMD